MDSEWQRQVSTLLQRSRDQLRPEYYEYLRKLYIDTLSENLRYVSIYSILNVARLFLKYLQKKGIRVEDIDVDLVKEYLAERRRRVKSLNKDVRMLRRLGRLLNKDFSTVKYPRERVRIRSPDELLTVEEFKKLLDAMLTLEYKAQLAVMWECGLRLKEVRCLRLRDVVAEEWGFRLNIRRECTKSEEGERTVAVVEYASLLAEWLNHHPAKNPEAFLFPSPYNPFKPQARNLFLVKLKKAAVKAGVNKNVYNHLLRHTAATRIYNLLGRMRPKEFLKFFGWRDMKMLNVYEHMASLRADQAYVDAILNKGERKIEEYKPELLKCAGCGALNAAKNIYCYRCGRKLREAYVERIEETVELADALKLLRQLNELLKKKDIIQILKKIAES